VQTTETCLGNLVIHIKRVNPLIYKLLVNNYVPIFKNN